MSLDAAESFFYDDARLTAWSDALGDVLSRARERTSPRASDHAVSLASS